MSPFLFQHILFENGPVMPVAFLIRKQRTQFAHKILMDFIATEVPEIMGAPLVTDGEENIVREITHRTIQGQSIIIIIIIIIVVVVVVVVVTVVV